MFRTPRYENTVKAWTLVPPSNDTPKSHYVFPTVASLDAETEDTVKRWNKWLEAEDLGFKIETGGHMVTQLTKKGRWL